MPNVLQFHEISRLLPYRPPWLLIDRVDDWRANEMIVARKAISGSDPMIGAHFPDGPSVVPGVLMIEAVAQAALLLRILSDPENPGHVFLGRTRAEFRQPAYVGDTLIVTVSAPRAVMGRLACRGTVHVDEVEICCIELLGAI